MAGESTSLGKVTKIGVHEDAFYFGFEVTPNACKSKNWKGYHAKIFKNDSNYETLVSLITAAYISGIPTVDLIYWNSNAQGEKSCSEHLLYVGTVLFNPL